MNLEFVVCCSTLCDILVCWTFRMPGACGDTRAPVVDKLPRANSKPHLYYSPSASYILSQYPWKIPSIFVAVYDSTTVNSFIEDVEVFESTTALTTLGSSLHPVLVSTSSSQVPATIPCIYGTNAIFNRPSAITKSSILFM